MKVSPIIWKTVIGFQGAYEVSDTGQVRSFRKGAWRLLKQQNRNGYNCLSLCRQGKAKKFCVHRLVAEAFIRPMQHGQQVDHIDGDRRNNLLSNLRIVSVSENQKRKVGAYDSVSKYKGVSFHQAPGKWTAYIVVNKKQIHLGLYDTEKYAAVAYDKAAVEYFGAYALTNKEIEARNESTVSG